MEATPSPTASNSTLRQPGFEEKLVAQYTERLLTLAARELPPAVRQRVDAQDVLQSVYRSFFRRLEAGRFWCEEASDVWRLLAAMTYNKARSAVRRHHQERRDVRREETMPEDDSSAARAPGPDDIVMFFDTMEAMLARVPDYYRPVMTLRLEGHSIAEIAEKVGRTERTVLRALARLAELAQEEEEEV